ncbi:paraquat-inducible protein A [Tateyamaria omphalii]|uniref:paraquat-inducible protein A n=1 Tax=Tateyamaria omphalii TaxID=299262 RepID=UPI001C98EFB6|nr:paraquat-inducible protein A [Tateyamaria omphalii]MBY5934726.1 paraquat-inducible protein A [Tateyamaria omphalii]
MDQTIEHGLDTLIACPKCDALYRVGTVNKGDWGRCERCHTRLFTRRRDAGLVIISTAFASTVLVIAALFLPFIEIKRLGFSNAATIVDAALAFYGGPLFGLSLAVVALIIALPLTRLVLTLYTLTPLVLDRRPWPGAKRAFRFSEAMRPWSMAEIFVVGCAVSLIKLTDLARVEIGPAFWMFVSVVVLMAVQNMVMCRWSVWKALDR